ncbi:hypothetical protein ACJMK2_014175 [Sinanodonta woodiana]|uniref:Uncharacterized protein n=1 Tax=Sinanodonta woodiana TaxID=1069815 RepID=A0ABD3V0M5_SINWO
MLYNTTLTARMFYLAFIIYMVQVSESSFASDATNLRSAMLSNDNVQQSLTLTGWFTLKWTDYRLTWQPSSFGDIEEIHIMPSEIWKPEVIIDNLLADIGVINDDNLQLTVTNTGDVLWEPPGLYTTHCEIDITYYPFDRQKCIIEMTSWSLTKDQLELDLASDNIDTEDLRTNGEWIIVSTSVRDRDLLDNKPDGTVVTSSQLDFILVIERRPAFYAINFILPIILSSFLSCVVFLVPIQAGEKVSYILTMILAIAVLLTLIADSLPHTSLTASVLGIYLAITMFLSVLCALITVLLLNIFHNEEKVNTRSTFYKLTSVIATVIHFKGCKNRCMQEKGNAGNQIFPNGTLMSKNMNNEVEGYDEMDMQIVETSISVNNGEKHVYTWAEMANIWDRFCFWVFITFTSLCTLSVLIALAVGGRKEYV